MSHRFASRFAQGRIFLGMFFVGAAALSWACTDDTTDEGTSTPGNDAGTPPTDAAVADAGPVPRVLLAQGFGATNELVAVDLADGGIAGRLTYPGSFATIAADGPEPYLLDETSDTVTKLDPREPWKAVATWNVHGEDTADGGLGADKANPIGLVAPASNKAYVVRYNRNQIAVLDPTRTAGGTASKYIDLSSLHAPGDTGPIDVTSAVYVASKKLVYVLLGNIDLSLVEPDGSKTNCPTVELAPTIIAIDPSTDAVVDLGGSGPGGGIALPGYNPINTSPLIYDAAGDRLILLEVGCTNATSQLVRRGVDAVNLGDGSATTLLDLNDSPFPSQVAFVDANNAAVAFYAAGRLWNPADVASGSVPIAGGVDTIVADGRGAYVGTRATTFSDGGVQFDVVSVHTDGGTSTLVTNPFTSHAGYVSGIAAWPHP